MAKFQIPLNGSNIVSKDRQQAFEDALVDNHKINNADGPQLKIADNGKSRLSSPSIGKAPDLRTADPQAEPVVLGNALDYTYTHQSRTMEIHQQYLSQQGEYIQLITAVLDQQRKVLENGNGTVNDDIIKTFQRTLDNFHSIREQGLIVHQEFLANQAEFSERFLSALEGGKLSVKKVTSTQKESQDSGPSKWVVQEPPIVLDEQVSTPPSPSEPDPVTEINQSSPQAAISAEILSEALLRIVGDKTGYPPEMLELNMDLEADLGIDSIKRVEILGTLEEEFPSLPSADTEILAQTRTLQEIVDYMNVEAGSPAATIPAEQVKPAPEPEANAPMPSAPEEPLDVPASETESQQSVAGLTAILLEIVAEKTGYPVEMLESDMDMEADLGIDSIKRVEILGTMEEREPGLPSIEAEALAELRTLGQIVELMSASQSPSKAAPPVESEIKKKDQQLELENTPVKLVSLPAPDQLEFIISKDRPVIVTNEGTPFTLEVVKALSDEGWKVILWDYPESLIKKEKIKLPKSTNVVIQENTGAEAIDTLINSIRAEQGTPGGFIHLHPLPADNGLFSDRENQLVKQVFLIAGAIKPDLNQLDSIGRRIFLSVTRTDGSLGMKISKSFQEGSGLPGLVKTLNWEWPDVFCRSVDISQDIDFQKAGELLMNEIHDPDLGLIEVGISTASRVTIERDNG